VYPLDYYSNIIRVYVLYIKCKTMGRKQKLRQERHAAKTKSRDQELASYNKAKNQAEYRSLLTHKTQLATMLTMVEDDDDAETTRAKNKILVQLQTMSIDDAGAMEDKDYVFPKSDLYRQARRLEDGIKDDDTMKKNHDDDEKEITDRLFMRGATEYGCVHCINAIGQYYILRSHLNGNAIHLAQPWFLEAAIRGSFNGRNRLMEEAYCMADPHQPRSLLSYWFKMTSKYGEWSGDSSTSTARRMQKLLKKNTSKNFKEQVTRICIICSQTDTETVTLQQCMGCSTYCYCSTVCQRFHYKEQNHGGECKQLKILNKYHKPYAKEIYKAAIRGDIVIPALEKLRNKLGLTRPFEEYQEMYDYGTHGGEPIDTHRYVVARNDGTVWIGSTPNPIGPPSTNTTTTTISSATSHEQSSDSIMSREVGKLKIDDGTVWSGSAPNRIGQPSSATTSTTSMCTSLSLEQSSDSTMSRKVDKLKIDDRKL